MGLRVAGISALSGTENLEESVEVAMNADDGDTAWEEERERMDRLSEELFRTRLETPGFSSPACCLSTPDRSPWTTTRPWSVTSSPALDSSPTGSVDSSLAVSSDQVLPIVSDSVIDYITVLLRNLLQYCFRHYWKRPCGASSPSAEESPRRGTGRERRRCAERLTWCAK